MNSDDKNMSLDELINKYKSLKYNDTKTKVISKVFLLRIFKFKILTPI